MGQLHQKRTVVEKGNLNHVSPPKTSAAPYQIAGRRDWLLIFVSVYGIFVEMSIFSLDLQRGPALRIDWGEREVIAMPYSGTLMTRVFTSRSQLPVEDAAVSILQHEPGGRQRLINIQTSDPQRQHRPHHH